MIRCLVIDDNDRDALDTKHRIETCFNKLAIDSSVTTTSDSKDILDHPFNYDFVFLDIELNQAENGIELGKKIKELNRDIHIIITSAYKEYLVDGYRIDADRTASEPFDDRREDLAVKPFETQAVNAQSVKTVSCRFGIYPACSSYL